MNAQILCCSTTPKMNLKSDFKKRMDTLKKYHESRKKLAFDTVKQIYREDARKTIKFFRDLDQKTKDFVNDIVEDIDSEDKHEDDEHLFKTEKEE